MLPGRFKSIIKENFTALFPVLIFLLTIALPASAVDDGGVHSFDGSNRNEVKGYLQGGDNIVTGFFMGPSLYYTRYLGNRWCLEGATDLSFGKAKYALYAKGAYRLPAGRFNFFFSSKAMYNRYASFNTNETCLNLSATWEAQYFELTVGETLIHYGQKHGTYTEPLTFTFGIGAHIRKRTNPWNIGLFFRNYDDFYYENWNINWGVRFNANLPARLKLFGELVLRPAGSLSQLATKYETSLKVGLRYSW